MLLVSEVGGSIHTGRVTVWFQYGQVVCHDKLKTLERRTNVLIAEKIKQKAKMIEKVKDMLDVA